MDRCSRRPASIDRSVPPQPAPSVATSHYRQTKHLLAFFFSGAGKGQPAMICTANGPLSCVIYRGRTTSICHALWPTHDKKNMGRRSVDDAVMDTAGSAHGKGSIFAVRQACPAHGKSSIFVVHHTACTRQRLILCHAPSRGRVWEHVLDLCHALPLWCTIKILFVVHLGHDARQREILP
jgi:hypothetical protein